MTKRIQKKRYKNWVATIAVLTLDEMEYGQKGGYSFTERLVDPNALQRRGYCKMTDLEFKRRVRRHTKRVKLPKGWERNALPQKVKRKTKESTP